MSGSGIRGSHARKFHGTQISETACYIIQLICGILSTQLWWPLTMWNYNWSIINFNVLGFDIQRLDRIKLTAYRDTSSLGKIARLSAISSGWFDRRSFEISVAESNFEATSWQYGSFFSPHFLFVIDFGSEKNVSANFRRVLFFLPSPPVLPWESSSLWTSSSTGLASIRSKNLK